MAKRTKNNIIVLIALAVLCLTASGSFWTGGQADAVYSTPVWDLPLFEADDAPESAEPSAEPAEPAVEAYGGTLTALYINGAYSTDCRIIDGKVRMTLAEFADVTGLAYSESALDGIQLHLAEGGEYVEVNGRYLYLEGYDIVGGALYFVNPDIGVSSWFRQTRTFVTSIGDHDFYA